MYRLGSHAAYAARGGLTGRLGGLAFVVLSDATKASAVRDKIGERLQLS